MSQIEVTTRYSITELSREMERFLIEKEIPIDRLVQAVDAEYVRAKIISDQVAKLGNVKLSKDGEAETKGSLALTWKHGKETAPITFARWNKMLSKVFRDFPGMSIDNPPDILRPWLAKLSTTEMQSAEALKTPKAAKVPAAKAPAAKAAKVPAAKAPEMAPTERHVDLAQALDEMSREQVHA